MLRNADELVLRFYQHFVAGIIEKNVCDMLKKLSIRIQIQLRLHFHHSMKDYQLSYIMRARKNCLHLRNLMHMLHVLDESRGQQWQKSMELVDELNCSIQRSIERISSKIKAIEERKATLAKVYYLDQRIETRSSRISEINEDDGFHLYQMGWADEEYYIYADDQRAFNK